MQYVSASDAKQRLAAILDTAQREPVMIRRQKRDVAVVLSVQEYERVCALNRQECSVGQIESVMRIRPNLS